MAVADYLTFFHSICGLNFPAGEGMGAETCDAESPLIVMVALRSIPSKFGNCCWLASRSGCGFPNEGNRYARVPGYIFTTRFPDRPFQVAPDVAANNPEQLIGKMP